MRLFPIVAGPLILLAAAGAAQAPPEVSRLQIDVENYSQGNCSFATVRRPDGPALFRLDDGCHGWSIEDCNGMLFLRTIGVIADGGTLIRSADSRPLDIPAAIDAALNRRTPPDEYLHLRFDRSRCTATTIELPFEGSYIGRGATGSAKALEGVVRAGRDDSHTVDLRMP